VGIKPNKKLVNDEKQGDPPGNEIGGTERKDVERKVNVEFEILRNESFYVILQRPADAVFLEVVKVVDDIACCRTKRRCYDDEIEVFVEQNLQMGFAVAEDEKARHILCQNEHCDVVTANDRKQCENFNKEFPQIYTAH